MLHAEKVVIYEQIDTWLREEIIHPSVSDYVSPIALVKKRDKSTRFRVEYRALDVKVIKFNYRLPVIEDQLDCLRGAKIFTTLHLKNGFFHVSIEDADCEYTAFVVSGLHYEFLRLPFGLCISPAYFQKYINAVIRDLVAKGIVVIYMDDLIIPAENLSEGKERLECVLRRASEYGL